MEYATSPYSWWTDRCLRQLTEIFPVSVVAIEHEDLSDIHKDWYARTVIMEKMRNFIGLEHHLIDMSLTHRAISKIASVATRMARKFRDLSPAVYGHSVTVIYRKKVKL